jgi:hypothetical protein
MKFPATVDFIIFNLSFFENGILIILQTIILIKKRNLHLAMENNVRIHPMLVG